MTICDELRQAVLQAAIQGKLTEQREEDGTAEELLEEIRKEKERLIAEGKIKKLILRRLCRLLKYVLYCVRYNKKGITSTPYTVSRYYRAPELIFGKIDYNSKIDIFATGCILAELFMLTPLFPGKTEGLEIFEHICLLGNPGKKYFEQFPLPKNYIDYFEEFQVDDTVKLEKLLNLNNFYNQKDVHEASDMILHMLNWDINKRYSAEQCLRHPFVNKRN